MRDRIHDEVWGMFRQLGGDPGTGGRWAADGRRVGSSLVAGRRDALGRGMGEKCDSHSHTTCDSHDQKLAKES
jgi:hypothetical protein